MTRGLLTLARAARILLVSSSAVLLVPFGCTSSELAIGPKDPANPGAATLPLPSSSAALAPNFDSADRSSPAAPSMHGMHHPMGTMQGEMSGNGTPHPDDAGAVKPSTQRWTCRMHPKVVRPGPGKCPICGMTLVPAPATDGGTP